MKKQSSLVVVIIAVTLMVALSPAQAASVTNSSQALSICKNTISERTDGTIYHKFRRDHVTSTRGGKFSFLINSTMKNDQKKYLLRSKCVISKTGDLITLEIEEGRW